MRTEYSSSAKFTWKIENISTHNTNKLKSDTFSAGGHKWRILFCPKDRKRSEFSVYSEAADWATLPDGWSISAKFRLSVINAKQEAEHTFNASERYRGFSVYNSCFDRDYLVNDTCTVRAEVWFNEEVEEKGGLKIEEKSDLNLDSVVVGAEDSVSFSFAEIDSLFTDIQTLLEQKLSEAETLIRSFSRTCSAGEIADAKRFLKRCLDKELSMVIQLERRTNKLKNSLATMIVGNAFPDNMVDRAAIFLTKLDRSFEKYIAAQQGLKEAEEKEKSIGKLKTVIKQLSTNFTPKRKQAEAVDREIAELKVKKARLRKSLEDLAGEATASKQSLVSAEEEMKLLRVKKEEAEKTVSDLEGSWESLKAGCSKLLP